MVLMISNAKNGEFKSLQLISFTTETKVATFS